MQKTKISWTDRSANPIRARRKSDGKVGWHCVKVSSGCAGCYSESMNRRLGTGLPFQSRSGDDVEVFLDRRPLEAILRLKKPQRIFLCDMTDLFGDFVSDDDILRIWTVMEEARHHTFQILTKRPERMCSWVSQYRQGLAWAKWPLPNVHLGTSVEDQHAADERIPHLLRTPAAVRFLSVEPLLGPVDLCLWRVAIPKHRESWPVERVRNFWVIIGGESGPKARPCDLEWIRSVVRQCRDTGTAAFVKQLGSCAKDEPNGIAGRSLRVHPDAAELISRRLRDPKGGDIEEFPEDLRIREMPS